MACVSPFPTAGQDLQDVLSALHSEEEGELLTEDELLQLEHLTRHPLDLNRIEQNELEEIPLVTSPDAALIIRIRNQRGRFRSAEDLKKLPGISTLAAHLLPLVTSVEPIPPIDVSLRNRWSVFDGDTRILTQGGFENEKISGGFTLERDPGETFLSDYFSGHIVTRLGENTTLSIGDFQAVTGYGLLLGPIAPPFKTPASLTRFARMGRGLRSHRSAAEEWALRGLAVSRTGSEKRWWASLTEKLAAFSWEQAGGPDDHFGVLLAYDRGTPADEFSPGRSPTTYGSLFGKIPLTAVDIFGEIAVYTGTSPAVITGLVKLDKILQWISIFRHYPKGFRGPRSQPFREFSSNELNETGIYQEITVRRGRHRLLTHGDIYRRSDHQGATWGTIHGFETMVIWTVKLTKKELSLRWKGEEKSVASGMVFSGEKTPRLNRRESWRLQGMMTPSRALTLQAQFDGTDVSDDDASSRGYGVTARVRVNRGIGRVTWSWTVFRVDDSPSRIYLWDLNLPAELRIKSFSGRGQSMAAIIGLTSPTGARISARVRSTWTHSSRGIFLNRPRLEGGIQIDIAF